MNRRRYLILFGIVIVIFIIFVFVIFLQTGSEQTTNSTSQQNQHVIQTSQKKTVKPAMPLASLKSNPVAAAIQFYQYYFSSPTNPLSNGAYKDNPYLSADFKDTISALYNNGNTPVFCPQNKRAAITVGDEEQIYYDNQYLRQEIITDATVSTQSAQQLYRITLKNDNGKWLVFDVTCIF